MPVGDLCALWVHRPHFGGHWYNGDHSGPGSNAGLQLLPVTQGHLLTTCTVYSPPL